MAEILMTKTISGQLAPMDDFAVQKIAALKVGQAVKITYKRVRNPRFHRKAFALFNLAFEAWDAPELEYKGLPVAKEFNQFRKDLTILAGHYEAVVNFRGEVRLNAKSLSFGNMDETEFAQVYKDILNTVWTRILSSKGYADTGKVERVVERLIGFE